MRFNILTVGANSGRSGTSQLVVGFFVVYLTIFSCWNGAAIPIKGRNGGVPCAVCTAVVALTEQMGVIYNETIKESFDRFCQVLPVKVRNACTLVGDFFIPQIVELLIDDVTADVVCHALRICFKETGLPYCHAFPPKQGDFQSSVARAKRKLAGKKSYWKTHSQEHDEMFDPCSLPELKELCELLAKVFTNDLPIFDPDKDLFSSYLQSWRGVSWRGRDCHDGDSKVHPGAKPVKGDIFSDSNCNGIKGFDPDTGLSYEDLLCSG